MKPGQELEDAGGMVSEARVQHLQTFTASLDSHLNCIDVQEEFDRIQLAVGWAEQV